jgi:hypothetical protein
MPRCQSTASCSFDVSVARWGGGEVESCRLQHNASTVTDSKYPTVVPAVLADDIPKITPYLDVADGDTGAYFTLGQSNPCSNYLLCIV